MASQQKHESGSAEDRTAQHSGRIDGGAATTPVEKAADVGPTLSSDTRSVEFEVHENRATKQVWRDFDESAPPPWAWK